MQKFFENKWIMNIAKGNYLSRCLEGIELVASGISVNYRVQI